jgi:hypothetical protein
LQARHASRPTRFHRNCKRLRTSSPKPLRRNRCGWLSGCRDANAMQGNGFLTTIRTTRMVDMIRDTCEIDEGNNECDPRTYFIPTSEEIQAACVEIQSCWTDDIRNSRRVISIRSLGNKDHRTWEPRNTRRPPNQRTTEHTEHTEARDKWVRFPGVEF